jgi:hypothetical protein
MITMLISVGGASMRHAMTAHRLFELIGLIYGAALGGEGVQARLAALTARINPRLVDTTDTRRPGELIGLLLRARASFGGVGELR